MYNFDIIRQNDPQGVIDGLLEQTARQGAALFEANQKIENLLTPEEAAVVMAAINNESYSLFSNEDICDSVSKKLKNIVATKPKRKQRGKKV